MERIARAAKAPQRIDDEEEPTRARATPKNIDSKSVMKLLSAKRRAKKPTKKTTSAAEPPAVEEPATAAEEAPEEVDEVDEVAPDPSERSELVCGGRRRPLLARSGSHDVVARPAALCVRRPPPQACTRRSGTSNRAHPARLGC